MRAISDDLFLAQLHQAVIQINRFERLDENRLPRGAGCMNHARHAAAVGRAHRNHEAIVPERDVIFARRFTARAHDLFERTLNCGARLDFARADALQLRRSIVADFAVGHHGAPNRGEQRTEIGERRGALRKARILRSVALECLPHRVRIFRERSDIQEFRGHEHRPGHSHSREPRVRIGQRAESKLRAHAQIGDGLANQFEFGFERGYILARLQRLDGAPAGHTRGRAADDFLQPVEFENLFCGARHGNLNVDCSPVGCPKSASFDQPDYGCN